MRNVRAWSPVGVLLAVAVVFSAAHAEEGRLSVRGVINTPPTSAAMSFEVKVIPVAPDEEGQYRVIGQSQVLRVDCDRTGSSGGEFSMELDVGREYEVRIDLIGEDGTARLDGTYYFADLTDQNQERSTPVVAGSEVPIPLRFQWGPRKANHGNFLLPRRSSRGGFDVAQYIAFVNVLL